MFTRPYWTVRRAKAEMARQQLTVDKVNVTPTVITLFVKKVPADYLNKLRAHMFLYYKP